MPEGNDDDDGSLEFLLRQSWGESAAPPSRASKSSSQSAKFSPLLAGREYATSAAAGIYGAIDDEWYLERRARCCACGRNVASSDPTKRGLRCSGCRRWFHYACRSTGHKDLKVRTERGSNVFFYTCFIFRMFRTGRRRVVPLPRLLRRTDEAEGGRG